jgi:hypothetical protein
MRTKKVFEISCFYCNQVFEYLADFASLINRAYCLNCKKLYLYDKWHRGVRWHEYKQYLQLIRNRFSSRQEENTILIQRKDGQLLKGGVSLGIIKKEDDMFVYVQKTPLDSLCPYRKELIKD